MPVEIDVLPNAPSAAEVAARAFVDAANNAIGARGEFVVALAGGSTPRGMYALLAAEPLASSLDWSRVQVLWGDERCVPSEHPSSNYRMARESLLDHVPVPGENVHRIKGEDDPVSAAIAYERVLRTVLRTPSGPPRATPGARFDFVLLGLGMDGHTASLFPGAATIHSTSRWVSEYLPATSTSRVTLTPTVLNAAAEVVFLVSGGAKAGVVRRVLEGPHRPDELPAQLIAPTAGRTRWFLDASAAAELRG